MYDVNDCKWSNPEGKNFLYTNTIFLTANKIWFNDENWITKEIFESKAFNKNKLLLDQVMEHKNYWVNHTEKLLFWNLMSYDFTEN